MSRVRRFTLIQRVNIDDLEHTAGLTVGYAGIDKEGLPVIEVHDANGVQFIAWKPDGRGVRPLPPVTDYSEEELQEVHPEDADLIYGLPYRVNPPQGDTPC